jgi:hypothetical protein
MSVVKIVAFGDSLISGTYKFYAGFKEIDNFINQKAELLSISGNLSFLSPNTLIIKEFQSGLFNEINIGKHCVKFDATEYLLEHELQQKSSFTYPIISQNEIENITKLFIDEYCDSFPKKSLSFLLKTENEKHFTSAFEKAFVSQMKQAFLLFKSDFYTSIRAFKSRGSGLTPSGDDFIAGILFGIHFWEQQDNTDYDVVKKRILEISKSENVFSDNMLRLASQSKYFMRLQDFLNTFFYVLLGDIKPVLEQLFAVGDTSGADILSGFLTTLLHKPALLNKNVNYYD